MNRSYSKIRHIQESNQILEKRILKEQTSDVYKNAAGGAAAGAATGAAIAGVAGGVVPVAGNLVGAVAGGVLGALIGGFQAIVGGTGDSDKKVKEVFSLCVKSQAPVTQASTAIADSINGAIAGPGTNEQQVYDSLRKLKTLDEFCSTVKSYNQTYGDLYSDLDGDFDSQMEWLEIMKPLRGFIANYKK
jgi:hypothetical protein